MSKTNAEAAEAFHASVRVHSFGTPLLIECDNCGGLARKWDYAPDYSRFCLECLSGLEDNDHAADRGCWAYHRG
jgi:hypothetical protein